MNPLIDYVQFDISPTGKYRKIIHFPEKTSYKNAIQKVQHWFDGPMTDRYFNKIKDDIYNEFEHTSCVYKDEIKYYFKGSVFSLSAKFKIVLEYFNKKQWVKIMVYA